MIACLLPMFVNAQTKKIKETFNADDKVHFDWEEYVDKKGGVEIKDDCLILTNKEKGTAKMTFVNLPINIENSFKITTSMIIPNLNDKECFGITIDNSEDFEKLCFFIKENKLKVSIIQNDVQTDDEFDEAEESVYKYSIKSSDNPKKIKLSGGKNVPVNIVIEKKGKKFIVSINNMTVYEKYFKSNNFMTSPTLGFIVKGNNVLKIDEIVVEQ